MIPYGKQEIDRADIDAVIEVLKSDFLTQGPKVPEFEKSIGKYCGAKFAVATTNATSALHLACLALDVGIGDIVWTTAITFAASANCALYCGARVDFVDIDPLTYNISVACLSKKLIEAKRIGKLPKVLVAVHLCGQSCDMEPIHKLSKEFGFSIIEDASHAVGGSYMGSTIGGCQFSDITVFSFHPVKIITTAEGGMALTNQVELDHRLRLLRSHGISSDQELFEDRPLKELWNYQQIDLGFNYRMTDLQAALGISQLERLDHYVSRRRSLASRYDKVLDGNSIVKPGQIAGSFSAWHLYVVRLLVEEIGITQKEIFSELRGRGIGVNLHYMPVYLHPYFVAKGFSRGYCPEAEKYFTDALTLPLFPTMTVPEQDEIVEILFDIIN